MRRTTGKIYKRRQTQLYTTLFLPRRENIYTKKIDETKKEIEPDKN